MNNYIVIPTVGRADLLGKLLPYLLSIISPEWRIVVVGSSNSDFPQSFGSGEKFSERVEFLVSEKGAATQRNFGIKKVLDDSNIILLMDDDFVPVVNYFSILEEFFSKNHEVVGINSTLLFDGAGKGGITLEAALDIIEKSEYPPLKVDKFCEVPSLYGCNMAVRSSALRMLQEWFDAELPLYSWLEDRDFSYRLNLHGSLVRLSMLYGVHLGYRKGRTSEVRYGYSQIANPVYLYRKKTLSLRSACGLIFRPVCMNILRFLWPELWIDRRGRLIGNCRAVFDLLRSSLHPGNIMRM